MNVCEDETDERKLWDRQTGTAAAADSGPWI